MDPTARHSENQPAAERYFGWHHVRDLIRSKHQIFERVFNSPNSVAGFSEFQCRETADSGAVRLRAPSGHAVDAVHKRQ